MILVWIPGPLANDVCLLLLPPVSYDHARCHLRSDSLVLANVVFLLFSRTTGYSYQPLIAKMLNSLVFVLFPYSCKLLKRSCSFCFPILFANHLYSVNNGS